MRALIFAIAFAVSGIAAAKPAPTCLYTGGAVQSRIFQTDLGAADPKPATLGKFDGKRSDSYSCTAYMGVWDSSNNVLPGVMNCVSLQTGVQFNFNFRMKLVQDPDKAHKCTIKSGTNGAGFLSIDNPTDNVKFGKGGVVSSKGKIWFNSYRKRLKTRVLKRL